VIKRVLAILDTRDRTRIIASVTIQVLLSLLDLMGVAIIGILAALAVQGIESRTPGSRVSTVLKILHLNGFSFQTEVAVLGILAATLLIGRTVLSIILTRRIMFYLSSRSAALSVSLARKIFSRPITEIQLRSNQENLYSITTGISTLMLGIVASTVSLISDLALLIVMAIGLLIVDPYVAGTTISIFAVLAWLLNRKNHQRSLVLGEERSALSIQSSSQILELLESYREIFVRNLIPDYVEKISKTRYSMSRNQAEMDFMPYVSKYVVETTVVLGALLIGGFQFALQDATHAVATLSIFMAAGSRIAPAALRIQQSNFQIQSGRGMAESSLKLYESLVETPATRAKQPNLELKIFEPKLEVKDISFRYPSRNEPTINNVSLTVLPNQVVAIVGPSGSGKSTLVDLILGVLPVDKGSIKISQLSPIVAIDTWPGVIGYVPQNVSLINGSIAENVLMGLSRDSESDQKILEALTTSQLMKYVQTLPEGIETAVGEHGTRLSGGQKQRLGIARALFTNPQFLVLDEATSSLDGSTEQELTQAIESLKGKVTIILIAHRLSTVMRADNIVYLKEGQVVAQGNFDELRRQVSDFDKQADLMGL
jgi:ATP-binding cassette, subfamily B, bacterial PglK